MKKEILFSCYSGAVKTLVDKKHAKKLGAITEDSSSLTDAQLKIEKDKKI